MNDQTMKYAIIVCIVVLVIILIVSIVTRLFRLAAVILVLILVIPPTISILCGNGAGYVEKISSFFTPEIQEQINDTYQDYSEREKQDPVLNEQGVQDALGDLWEKTKEIVSGKTGFSDESD